MTYDIAGALVLVGRDGSRGELPIGRRPVLLGRDPWADVVVRHPAISRHHAMIWAEPGKLFVRDLGASGGTWVEGRLLAAGEAASVGRSGTIGLGGALDLKWTIPVSKLTPLPAAGRVVLESAEEGWQLLEAPGQAESTALSDTSPGGPEELDLSLSPDFLEALDDLSLSMGEVSVDVGDDLEPPTEEGIEAVPSGAGNTDEMPTARLKAMGDLLMGASQELEDYVATASLPVLSALVAQDAVQTGPQQAVGPLRVVFTGKSGVVEELDSGNRTRLRGESRVALLRVLSLRLAAFRAGEYASPRVADVDLARTLWPDELGDAGPRIDLLIRRLQKQLRQAGLPADLVSRDDAGTRLLPTCVVPGLPSA
jgi:hypothetical protein